MCSNFWTEISCGPPRFNRCPHLSSGSPSLQVQWIPAYTWLKLLHCTRYTLHCENAVFPCKITVSAVTHRCLTLAFSLPLLQVLSQTWHAPDISKDTLPAWSMDCWAAGRTWLWQSSTNCAQHSFCIFCCNMTTDSSAKKTVGTEDVAAWQCNWVKQEILHQHNFLH